MSVRTWVCMLRPRRETWTQCCPLATLGLVRREAEEGGPLEFKGWASLEDPVTLKARERPNLRPKKEQDLRSSHFFIHMHTCAHMYPHTYVHPTHEHTHIKVIIIGNVADGYALMFTSTLKCTRRIACPCPDTTQSSVTASHPLLCAYHCFNRKPICLGFILSTKIQPGFILSTKIQPLASFLEMTHSY